MITYKTILCVDDDEDDRFFLCNTIKTLAPQLVVVEAGNGVEALAYLEHAKQSLPCLVVLDINMPLMDGKQTLERIRADSALSKLKIVFYTSTENPYDRAFFQSIGIRMVTKPFNVEQLPQIVSGFISTSCI